uniref:FLYWCH-type domain-containing protein n=1 Tax=Ditylenchus dipsaci TaxID=166011 RepID=A0A915DZT7_9BILA
MLKDETSNLYWRHSQRGDRTYWRCIYFQAGANGEKGTRCGGRAVTFKQTISITTAHNHLVDRILSELKRFQGEVQKLAKEARSRLETSSPVQCKSQHSMQPLRSRLEPANPKTLQELVIPIEYQLYGKEVFLKFDGWNGKDRVQMFSTDRCLNFFVAERKIGADGTWGVVPLLYDNLWILYAGLLTRLCLWFSENRMIRNWGQESQKEIEVIMLDDMHDLEKEDSIDDAANIQKGRLEYYDSLNRIGMTALDNISKFLESFASERLYKNLHPITGLALK